MLIFLMMFMDGVDVDYLIQYLKVKLEGTVPEARTTNKSMLVEYHVPCLTV